MSQASRKVKIGIMPLKKIQEWTISVAKGECKPKPNGPKIWFPSIKSLANVLSEDNQKLLQIIAKKKPSSIMELELLTGRKASNLLRTLRKMESCGLVKLVEGERGKKGRAPLIPQVLFNKAEIEINFFY